MLNLSKEELHRKQKQWRDKNKDKVRRKHKQWRDKNKEKIKAYREENKEYFQKYGASWRKRKKHYHRDYQRRTHDKVIDFLGGKCVACGATDKRILQINHINHGGTKEYENGTQEFYRSVLNGTRRSDDLDVRCANCNIIYNWKDKERTC